MRTPTTRSWADPSRCPRKFRALVGGDIVVLCRSNDDGTIEPVLTSLAVDSGWTAGHSQNVTAHNPPPAVRRRAKTGLVVIRDVAEAAGVSHQTVSRVINGHRSVRETTRQTVLASIRDLGFRPNRAARALASGQLRSVTVLTPDTRRYGYASILHGIEEAAQRAGFSVGIHILASSGPDDVQAAVERVGDLTGGAVIVIAYDVAGVRALQALPAGTMAAAAVEVSASGKRQPYPHVWLDDRAAATQATRFLLGLGHETVHYVPIPSSTRTSDRTEGWRRGLTEAGAVVPDLVPGGWTPGDGYRAGLRLAADDRVTAILCGNDDLALGVLRAMHQAGRAVPDSVSVVGFDDSPQSAFYTPALTTMRMDFEGLGRDCFHLLNDHYALTSPGAVPRPSSAASRPELILRASASPPSAGR